MRVGRQNLSQRSLVHATELGLDADRAHSIVGLTVNLQCLRMQVHLSIKAVKHGILDVLDSLIFKVADFANFIRLISYNFDRFLQGLKPLGQEVQPRLRVVLNMLNGRVVVLAQLIKALD